LKGGALTNMADVPIVDRVKPGIGQGKGEGARIQQRQKRVVAAVLPIVELCVASKAQGWDSQREARTKRNGHSGYVCTSLLKGAWCTVPGHCGACLDADIGG
jgi:hypothetical protein